MQSSYNIERNVINKDGVGRYKFGDCISLHLGSRNIIKRNSNDSYDWETFDVDDRRLIIYTIDNVIDSFLSQVEMVFNTVNLIGLSSNQIVDLLGSKYVNVTNKDDLAKYCNYDGCNTEDRSIIDAIADTGSLTYEYFDLGLTIEFDDESQCCCAVQYCKPEE